MNFRATYYVDPNATLPPDGSEGAPYPTIAAAFAAALLLGLTGALVLLPPETTITENVVMPSVGTNWEIACQGSRRATISGSLVCSSVPAARYQLTNLIITGPVSGTSSGTNILYLSNTRLSSSLNLTGIGAGFWFTVCQGLGTTVNSFGGAIIGAVSVVGALHGDTYYFGASLSAGSYQLNNCRTVSSIIECTSALSASNTARLTNMLFGAALSVTGTLSLANVTMDGVSLESGINRGLVLTNAVLKTLNSNLSADRLVNGNLATSFNGGANPQPRGQYKVTVTSSILTPGTSGLLNVNVTYKSLLGANVTLPVTSGLDISAIGEDKGQEWFAHDGSIGIGWTVTGIVVPGALSAVVIVTLQRLN